MYSRNSNSKNFIPIGSGKLQEPKYSFKAKGLDLAAQKRS